MVRPSSRERIVDAALRAFAAAEGDVTVDAVARVAGVTKQGVLYHFADKRELRLAMLDAVLRRWERHMEAELGAPLADVEVGARIRAYARVSARGDVVPGEAELFAQVLAHADEATVYAAWVESTFAASDDAHLTTAWLAANSLWSTLATGKRRLGPAEVERVLAVIDELTQAAR